MSGRPAIANIVSSEDTLHETEEFDIEEPDTNLLQNHESPGISHHGAADQNNGRVTSHRLTFLNIFALIVGMAIGSGIFASPSRVDSNVPSPGIGIVIWGVAGLIGWAGAASFAELGAAIPKNGGMQEYLRYIYGDFLASIMSWTWIMAVKPSSIAIISMIFADYWTSILVPPSTAKPLWLVKLLALLTVGCVLLINCTGAKSSTGLTNTLLYSKLSTVAFIILLAVPVVLFSSGGDDNEPAQDWKSRDWFARRRQDEDGSSVDWTSISTWDLLGHLTTALYAALWACGGWDNVNLVVAEMRDPILDLPRAVHTAIPTVTVCFVLTNLAYYTILPWKVLAASEAIAVAVGRQTLGTAGGLIFAILVSASCLGVLNIDVYTSGILTVASARHGYLPRFLIDPDDQESSPRRTHRSRPSSITPPPIGKIGQMKRNFIKILNLNRSSVPIRAMVFNALSACPFILLGTFGPLVTMSGIAGYAFFFLTVFGLLILRVTQPALVRPYKPYLFAPVLFCLFSAFLVLRGLIYAPVQGSLLVFLVLAGGVVHFYKLQMA